MYFFKVEEFEISFLISLTARLRCEASDLFDRAIRVSQFHDFSEFFAGEKKTFQHSAVNSAFVCGTLLMDTWIGHLPRGTGSDQSVIDQWFCLLPVYIQDHLELTKATL